MNVPHIGHVHLKVSDLERSVTFYQDMLGFKLTQRYGESAAFLSFGGYHHHLGLNTWQSKGGAPAPARSPGLFHFAILYPTQGDLAVAFKRLVDRGMKLDGAADHGVSLALYVHDPDENGIELYWDRPQEEWPHNADGSLAMVTDPIDLEALLSLATSPQ